MKILKLMGYAALGLVLAGAARAETTKVGVVLPFSGVNADIGNVINNGLKLYLALHVKDLGGNTIELIDRDSGDPTGAGAKTAVTELITRDHVQLLTGFAFSPDAIASAPVVNQAKVPMIVTGGATSWITNLSPYITRTAASMWQSSFPLGTYAAKELGCREAAAGYTDFPPGKDAVEAFKTGFEAAGGKVIDEIPMGNPSQVPDFTPFLQRVKDAKPQCFYVFVPSGNHAAALMKTIGDVGLAQAGIKVIGQGDIVTDDHLQEIGDPAIGVIVMFYYAYDYDNPANEAFKKAWHAAYGAQSRPNFAGVAGWDAMAAIVHAVQALNGKTDDGEKVMAALRGWSFDSPRGHIMLDPDTRDIVQDEHAEQVYKKSDGSLGIKVVSTIPAVKDPCKELKIGRCK
jgi:branched-chain amino acid transport system substrate-binding protein